MGAQQSAEEAPFMASVVEPKTNNTRGKVCGHAACRSSGTENLVLHLFPHHNH